jgi:protein TonB
LTGSPTTGGAAPAVRARASSRPSAGAEPIIEVIFEASKPKRSAQLLAGAVAALATHGAFFVWAALAEPSLESWAADVAMRVHAALHHEQIVELAEPALPPPPPPAPEAPPPKDLTKSPPPVRPARARAVPPAPAQAGAIVAREPDPSAPVDLTADSYVSGSANAYAGGITASRGTNPKAVDPGDVEPATGPSSAVGGPDQSRPVALEAAEWRCAWPREADAEQIDEQTAVIRVVVRPDGSVESAQVVQDPGFGFGAAAVRCALGTRFVPAEDRQGRRVRAKSPPIRVRFTR